MLNIRIFADSSVIAQLKHSDRSKLLIIRVDPFPSSLTRVFRYPLPGHSRIHLPERSLHSTARPHHRRVAAALGEGHLGRTALGDHGKGRESCDPGKVLRR